MEKKNLNKRKTLESSYWPDVGTAIPRPKDKVRVGFESLHGGQQGHHQRLRCVTAVATRRTHSGIRCIWTKQDYKTFRPSNEWSNQMGKANNGGNSGYGLNSLFYYTFSFCCTVATLWYLGMHNCTMHMSLCIQYSDVYRIYRGRRIKAGFFPRQKQQMLRLLLNY